MRRVMHAAGTLNLGAKPKPAVQRAHQAPDRPGSMGRAALTLALGHCVEDDAPDVEVEPHAHRIAGHQHTVRIVCSRVGPWRSACGEFTVGLWRSGQVEVPPCLLSSTSHCCDRYAEEDSTWPLASVRAPLPWALTRLVEQLGLLAARLGGQGAIHHAAAVLRLLRRVGRRQASQWVQTEAAAREATTCTAHPGGVLHSCGGLAGLGALPGVADALAPTAGRLAPPCRDAHLLDELLDVVDVAPAECHDAVARLHRLVAARQALLLHLQDGAGQAMTARPGGRSRSGGAGRVGTRGGTANEQPRAHWRAPGCPSAVPEAAAWQRAPHALTLRVVNRSYVATSKRSPMSSQMRRTSGTAAGRGSGRGSRECRPGRSQGTLAKRRRRRRPGALQRQHQACRRLARGRLKDMAH